MTNISDNMDRRQVSRVLISVSDKTKIIDLAKKLNNLGIEIVSTGGTSQVISDEGINVVSVDNVTNFPEMMGGRGRPNNDSSKSSYIWPTRYWQNNHRLKNSQNA